jgi:glucuronyl/N-acetylglucosaminyl transferase EXT2
VDEAGNAVTLPISKEFYDILEAIADSPFYTNDPEMACLLIPSIDVLNQNYIRLKEIGQVLASLPW